MLLHCTFWITGQGVLYYGEIKSQGNQFAVSNESKSSNTALVIVWKPETRWSIPEQDEAGVKFRGGLKQWTVYVLVWFGYRGEKPIESGNCWFLSKLAVVKPLWRKLIW